MERDVRAKIDGMYYEVFTSTQNEVTKRWTYESEIKRPYFHVTELEHAQLSNWRKYLDFEEAEGDFDRVVCLYERCLVTCALYDEFWFRYSRWMSAQVGKEEEARNIYIKASTMFVPVSRPGIRLQWAYFEESCGRVEVALDIHAALLMKLADCTEVIVSWANMQRRQNGIDAAIQTYKDHIDAPTVDLFTKAALVSEWALAVWNGKGSADDARAIFLKNLQWYADSRYFWQKWFQFELEQGLGGRPQESQGERLKHVYGELKARSRLSAAAKKELAQAYMSWLVQRGDKESMKMFLEVDREVYGYVHIWQHALNRPLTLDRPASVVPKMDKENGAQGELDEASRRKAEAQYLNFYEAHFEPAADAQGTADFN